MGDRLPKIETRGGEGPEDWQVADLPLGEMFDLSVVSPALAKALMEKDGE